MATRGRRTKAGDLIAMVAVGVVVYVVFGDRVPGLAWGLIAVSAVLVWITLFLPTYCDVETNRRQGCSRPAYGKLRACQTHAREKRDAVFRLFNLKNPGLFFRVMWSSVAHPSRLGDGERARATSQRAAYEVVMLFAALVSAGAAVLALF